MAAAAGKHEHGRPRPHMPLARAALAAGIAIACGAAQAQPVGPTVIHGQASFSASGSNLVVTTQNGQGTSHSAINWQSFSVPAGTFTRFDQPSAASTSINRVTGADPSSIFGTLSSNGRLVLVNPAGIAIGTGAVVDTAGFTASTLRMAESDAIAGRLLFDGGSRALQVGGQLVARGGDVVLIAPSVQADAGAVIQVVDGAAVLAAGQKVELTGRGLEGIHMLVQAPTDQAVNLGTLQGHAVGMFAGTLRHSGVIQAQAAVLEGGKVVLKAGEVAIDHGSIAADGSAKVTLDGAKVTMAQARLGDGAGTLDLSVPGGALTLTPPLGNSMDYSALLQDVNLGANLQLAGGGVLAIQGDLVLPDAATLIVGNSTVRLHGASPRLRSAGSATLRLEGGALQWTLMPPGGRPPASATGSDLTIASGVTVRGQGKLQALDFRPADAEPVGRLVNAGEIRADVAQATLSVEAASVRNEGQLVAAGGKLALDSNYGAFFGQSFPMVVVNAAGGSISNTGGLLYMTLAANDGQITLTDAGTVLHGKFGLSSLQSIRRSGGWLTLERATVDLEGATLDIGAAGQGSGISKFQRAVLRNGTLVSRDGSLLAADTLGLDNVVIGSDITLNPAVRPEICRYECSGDSLYVTGDRRLVLADGVVLSLGVGGLGFGQSTASITSPGRATVRLNGNSLVWEGPALNSTTDSFTVASGITLQGHGSLFKRNYGGYPGGNGHFILAGVLLADEPGKSFQLGGDILEEFINTGTMLLRGGDVTLTSGGLRNLATGRIRIEGATLDIANAMWNDGEITMASAAGKPALLRSVPPSSVFSFAAPGVLVNGTTGRISGDGILQLPRWLDNRGVLAPGGTGAVGTLSITGGLVTDNGRLELDLASTSDYDRIIVSGAVAVGTGTRIDAANLQGARYAAGDAFGVVESATDITGTLPTVTGMATSVVRVPGKATLQLQALAPVPPVQPVPPPPDPGQPQPQPPTPDLPDARDPSGPRANPLLQQVIAFERKFDKTPERPARGTSTHCRTAGVVLQGGLCR